MCKSLEGFAQKFVQKFQTNCAKVPACGPPARSEWTRPGRRSLLENPYSVDPNGAKHFCSTFCSHFCSHFCSRFCSRFCSDRSKLLHTLLLNAVLFFARNFCTHFCSMRSFFLHETLLNLLLALLLALLCVNLSWAEFGRIVVCWRPSWPSVLALVVSSRLPYADQSFNLRPCRSTYYM